LQAFYISKNSREYSNSFSNRMCVNFNRALRIRKVFHQPLKATCVICGISLKKCLHTVYLHTPQKRFDTKCEIQKMFFILKESLRKTFFILKSVLILSELFQLLY